VSRLKTSLPESLVTTELGMGGSSLCPEFLRMTFGRIPHFRTATKARHTALATAGETLRRSSGQAAGTI
jgi:hypothetical protein